MTDVPWSQLHLFPQQQTEEPAEGSAAQHRSAEGCGGVRRVQTPWERPLGAGVPSTALAPRLCPLCLDGLDLTDASERLLKSCVKISQKDVFCFGS